MNFRNSFWLVLGVGAMACGGSDDHAAKDPSAPKSADNSPQALHAGVGTGEVHHAAQGALWDTKANSGLLLPKSRGENLIPDPTFANWRENWAVKFSGPVQVQDVAETSDTLSTFETVQTLRVTTDQRCEITLRKPVMVHATSPGEIYRFRLWLKIDPANAADCTFGVLGFDASGQAVQMLAQGGERVAEANFTDIKLGYVSWLFINHYLMPAWDVQHTWVEPRDAVGLSFQAPPNLVQLTPRFVLNARDGEAVTFQLALPSIDAVDLALSDARTPSPVPAP